MDQGWTIDIDAVGDAASATDRFEDQLAAFEEALNPYNGAVAGSDDHDRYGARFSISISLIG